MIVAVSGWRDWSNKSVIVQAVGSLMKDPIPMFRMGDCPTGADAWMLELVAEFKLPYERYVADWDQYATHAGPLRNRAMLKGQGYTAQRANLLLAFPEPHKYPKIPGSGTWGCIGEAAALGIQTVVFPSERFNRLTGYGVGVFSF